MAGRRLNILVVSNEGLATDLCWKLKKEGHSVRFHIRNADAKDIGDGFIDKVGDWRKSVGWADFVIFDDCLGLGKLAEEARKMGKPVVGGTEYTDRLEDDREFGQEVMKSVGIPILPRWEFTDFDSAIRFVKKNPGRYVLKPCGKIADKKELLFVGMQENGEDMLQMLEEYRRSWGKKMATFIFQKYSKGVEIAVGAFFNGKKFITPINVNFEHKHLFDRELGPSTGEMGTSMFWCPPNRMYKQTLEKMVPILAKQKYVGYFDIDCIVNETGIHPLEFTSRFGYPTISIFMEGITSPWGEFLYSIAKGEDYRLKSKEGFQIGVVIAVPPFPFENKEIYDSFSRDAVVLFKGPIDDGFHLGDLKLVKGRWRVTGGMGWVMIATGSGETMKEAQEHAYKRVENVMVPNMFYRTDIGDRWTKDREMLKTWGYLY